MVRMKMRTLERGGQSVGEKVRGRKKCTSF